MDAVAGVKDERVLFRHELELFRLELDAFFWKAVVVNAAAQLGTAILVLVALSVA